MIFGEKIDNCQLTPINKNPQTAMPKTEYDKSTRILYDSRLVNA